MAGPSLAITFDELQVAIADHQGFSLDPTKWNPKQKYVIGECTKSGVARVYKPKPLDGREVAIEWSWLRPQTDMFLASGAQQIRLPAEFGSFAGILTLKTTQTNSSPFRVQWRNEGVLRGLYSTTPSATGQPRFASEGVERGPDGVDGQHKILLVYPAADQDYTVQAVWNINPNRLTGSNPQCYGGEQYRELFLESCLAVAEQRFDNAPGVHTALFEQMLAAAISADNRNKPQKLGYNGNRAREYLGRHSQAGPVTYNGQSFD